MEIKTRIFKRSKSAWTDETLAMADVVAAQSVSEKRLKPMHTDEHFIWTIDEDKATGFPVFRVAMAEVENDVAIQLAMDHLDTFEGNLLTEHSETEYIFSKVRG